jgi:hypothetical protein
MGPLQNANLYKGQPGTSAATLATVPSGQDWIIDNVVACNTDAGGPFTFTLNVVPSGGSAGVTNRLASVFSVAASTTTSLSGTLGKLGIVMQPGDTLNGLQATASKVTLFVTGSVRPH